MGEAGGPLNGDEGEFGPAFQLAQVFEIDMDIAEGRGIEPRGHLVRPGLRQGALQATPDQTELPPDPWTVFGDI